jgi:hypothetical protein
MPPLILLEDLLLLFSLFCIPVPPSSEAEKSRNADGVKLPSEKTLAGVALMGPL